MSNRRWPFSVLLKLWEHICKNKKYGNFLVLQKSGSLGAIKPFFFLKRLQMCVQRGARAACCGVPIPGSIPIVCILKQKIPRCANCLQLLAQGAPPRAAFGVFSRPSCGLDSSRRMIIFKFLKFTLHHQFTMSTTKMARAGFILDAGWRLTLGGFVHLPCI